jgi:hypothetical protein
LAAILAIGKPVALLARRGTRHARVHLNDNVFTVDRIDGELDVATAGVHTDLADDGEGGIAEALVFLVGEGLGGSDGDTSPV